MSQTDQNKEEIESSGDKYEPITGIYDKDETSTNVGSMKFSETIQAGKHLSSCTDSVKNILVEQILEKKTGTNYRSIVYEGKQASYTRNAFIK